jgi:putative spermidine/putrescine transport system ATP-binding protein
MGDNNRIAATVLGSSEGHCTARTPDGTVLKCRLRHPVEAHAAIDICVRPEKLSLAPAAASNINRLKATVEKYVFFGDHYRLYCRTNNSDEVMVKIQHQGEHEMLESGSTVYIHFRSNDCIAFGKGPAPLRETEPL